MIGSPSSLLDQSTSKPHGTQGSIRRLAGYFRPYWILLIVALVLLIASSWAQVITPDLTGQAVNCFFTPAVANSVSDSAGGSIGDHVTTTSAADCWYDPLPSDATTADYMAGLLQLVLLLAALYAGAALMTGLLAYIMAWAGQRAIRRLQMELFGQLQSLSLDYYDTHSFGDLMSRVTNDVSTLQQVFSFGLVRVLNAERIFELLDVVPEIQQRPDAKDLPPVKGKITYDQVYAGYVPGDNTLKNVSFTVEAGKSLAIVGPTGAGKSTLVNLIPRFYDVNEGAVRIDDIDVRDATLDSLRRQVGIVLQDIVLFSDTVINNIRFGRPTATQEEVVAAARLAHADDFIQHLPQGYDTLLSEHGGGLSEGQQQLISIARTALTDPRVLIMDEATSSVDSRTEPQVLTASDKLMSGRTSNRNRSRLEHDPKRGYNTSACRR